MLVLEQFSARLGPKAAYWLPAFPAASPGCIVVLRASLEGSSTYVLKLHGNIRHGVFGPITLHLFFSVSCLFLLSFPSSEFSCLYSLA